MEYQSLSVPKASELQKAGLHEDAPHSLQPVRHRLPVREPHR